MALSDTLANLEAVRESIAKSASSIEEITGFFADRMLTQTGLHTYPQQKPLVVFDNDCREGILTLKLQEILKDRPQHTFEVICGDFTKSMLDIVKQRIGKEGWTNTTVVNLSVGGTSANSLQPTAETLVHASQHLGLILSDIQATHLPKDHFTHILSNFGIMSSPDPAKGLVELHRILRPGGTLAFTTWQTIPWYPDMKAAMETIPALPKLPDAAEMETALPNIFSPERIWHDPEAIQRYMTQQGFVNVVSNVVSTTSEVKDLEDLRRLLRPPMTLVTRFFWTQEQRDDFDSPEILEKVLNWFEGRMKQERLIRWRWDAIVTFSTRPL